MKYSANDRERIKVTNKKGNLINFAFVLVAMFSGKLRSFVGCCWYDSSGLIQTQNNSNIEIGKAVNIYKKFFNLNLFL